MDAFSIITKKKLGGELSSDETRQLVCGYLQGTVTAAQMAALLMACRLNGMTSAETAALTMAMAESGEKLDLEGEPFLDKHSTGGVGDKTTFLVGSMLSACGYHVAMMSGRGLGHTGGTIDKLESVSGWKALSSPDDYIAIAKDVGFAMMEQTEKVAPADKLLYALRNETSTIDSPALIAASIMSKKIASGTRNIVLDVKYGPGAFMKQEFQARELADTMEQICAECGIKAAVELTAMENVLGMSVGNACEIRECWEMMTDADALHHPLREDLRELSVRLAADVAALVDERPKEEIAARLAASLEDGSAAEAFSGFIHAHGGRLRSDGSPIFSDSGSARSLDIAAKENGTIGAIDLERLGLHIAVLGANKFAPGDSIRHDVGLQVYKKKGMRCEKGEVLARLEWVGDEPVHRDAKTIREAADDIRGCLLIA